MQRKVLLVDHLQSRWTKNQNGSEEVTATAGAVTSLPPSHPPPTARPLRDNLVILRQDERDDEPSDRERESEIGVGRHFIRKRSRSLMCVNPFLLCERVRVLTRSNAAAAAGTP